VVEIETYEHQTNREVSSPASTSKPRKHRDNHPIRYIVRATSGGTPSDHDRGTMCATLIQRLRLALWRTAVSLDQYCTTTSRFRSAVARVERGFAR
jgi:hypothetical protein